MMRKATALLMCLTFILSAFCSCAPVVTETSCETEKAPFDSSETTVAADMTDTDMESGEGTETDGGAVLVRPTLRYDKHLISSDAREHLTDREEELYRKTVDSILAHNGVVEGFASREEYENVRWALFWEFVPFSNMVKNYHDMDDPFVYENGRAEFFFKGDKEYCDGVYAAFENVVNGALFLVREDDGEWERVARLYRYVSESMRSGSPAKQYGVSHDIYNCIKYKMGGQVEFDCFLRLLATQAGFDTKCAYSVGEKSADGMSDFIWTMIRVEDSWYHFDAHMESTVHKEDPLTFFAMDTELRRETASVINIVGERFELEMFVRNEYDYDQKSLPQCGKTMSDGEKVKLYNALKG